MKSLFVASKFLFVLASVHSRLDYCNSVLHSLPWVSFTAASFCVEFDSTIDSWPRAISSYIFITHVGIMEPTKICPPPPYEIQNTPCM